MDDFHMLRKLKEEGINTFPVILNLLDRQGEVDLSHLSGYYLISKLGEDSYKIEIDDMAERWPEEYEEDVFGLAFYLKLYNFI